MNALVIGYGSIGERHCRLLTELGCSVGVVSSRALPGVCVYSSIGEAMYSDSWDYIVVANRTHQHYAALKTLRERGYSGDILVEKPLFERLMDLPDASLSRVYAAYNLRFHPILQQLRELIQGQRVLSAQVYTGQYLPGWRQQDYRKVYSARRHEGGGVLLDLSHELDYLLWLFGPWRRLVACGGRYSTLEIDSDDIYTMLIEMSECSIVNLQLNYVDRQRQRQIIVNTDEHTYTADLVGATLKIDGETHSYCLHPDVTYLEQHKALLGGSRELLCPASEANDSLYMIERAHSSVRSGGWVSNEKAMHHLRARRVEGHSP
ncbi:Gfo/Idh/MocA family protein [Paenibacillus daejeonensis]|uniref:Gfo/Idh/MocA family protein n=1 Tax=Paenibacillus daejeonensis TaxID=135193 RepID=UPI000379415B|nr:Gfo/Idh/MocA family oxidoreductase [Paenibacillus daejeonensis]